MLAGAAMLSGCAMPDMSAWGWPGFAPAKPAVATTAPAADDVPESTRVPYRIVAPPQPQPRVRLFKITLPYGAFSENEKVWRQLDEDALDSATTVMLARNGIRAAVGPQARWETIAKMLDIPGATFSEYYCQTDGRSAINIVTREGIPQQQVFYVDKDLQLLGRTFDKCDNALRMSMSMPRGSTTTTIQLEPMVQVGTVTVARGEDQMGVVRMTIPREETFANLRLAASVQAQDFLVLAPSDMKKSPFSVGSRFLSDTDKVPAMETVLVFVPMPMQQPDQGGGKRK